MQEQGSEKAKFFPGRFSGRESENSGFGPGSGSRSGLRDPEKTRVENSRTMSHGPLPGPPPRATPAYSLWFLRRPNSQ